MNPLSPLSIFQVRMAGRRRAAPIGELDGFSSSDEEEAQQDPPWQRSMAYEGPGQSGHLPPPLEEFFDPHETDDMPELSAGDESDDDFVENWALQHREEFLTTELED